MNPQDQNEPQNFAGSSTTPGQPPAAEPEATPGPAPSATVGPASPAATPVVGTEPGDPAALPPPEQPLPTPPVAMTANPLPMAGHKRRKKGLIIGLVAAVLVLVLSAAAAASYYYIELNKPENILKQALANTLDLSKAKTIEFSGSSDAKSTTDSLSMASSFKGVVDNTTGAFDISGETDAYLTKLTVGARSVDGKTFYLKVGGLDGLAQLLASTSKEGATAVTAYAPLIDMVNNQWFEINESLLKQYIPGYKASVLKEADTTKIKDAYLAHPFLVVKEVMANETLKGKDHYHYKLVIGSTELKAFLTALKDANLEAVKLDQKMLDAMKRSLDGQDLSKFPFELWISKDDKMIRQLSFKVSEKGVAAEAKLTIESYNQPVKVEKPEGAKSILELLGGLFGGGAPTDLPLTVPSELQGGSGSISL